MTRLCVCEASSLLIWISLKLCLLCSGPRLLKDTKDNIKMDISGPEFPRSLMDDSPLDERR